MFAKSFITSPLQCGRIWTDCNYNKESLKQHGRGIYPQVLSTHKLELTNL